MITVSVSEAKSRLAELIRRAEAGERVVITRRGQPVGEVVGASACNAGFSLEAIHRQLEALGHPPDGRDRIPDDFDEIDVWGTSLNADIDPEAP